MSLPNGWTVVESVPRQGGGQGEVFCVTRPGDSKRYALKRLADPKRSGRLERELTTMRMLEEAGISVVPPIVESGIDEKGRPYLVLPWYSAGSLQDAIDAKQFERKLVEALMTVHRLAGGLEAIHQAGVAHRDLKPGNVLMDESGHPLLADFGLCLTIPDLSSEPGGEDQRERLTESDRQIGSRLYIAPENEAGFNPEVDQRPADFWAFGKTLWTVLTGKRPLSAADQLLGPNRLGSLLGTAFIPLDVLSEELLIRDARARLRDWGAVKVELESAIATLQKGPHPGVRNDDSDAGQTLAAALEAAKRFAASPRTLQEKADREKDLNAEVDLAKVREALQAGTRMPSSAYGQLAEAVQGTADIWISQGGPGLAQILALGAFAAAGVEAYTSSALSPEERSKRAPACVLIRAYPIDRMPMVGLGVWFYRVERQLWIGKVPYLVINGPGGSSSVRFPPVLSKAFGAAYGPLRLGLKSTEDAVTRIGADLAREGLRLASSYLRLVSIGSDLQDPQVWALELGVELGSDSLPLQQQTWQPLVFDR